ncbi:hypothetical protein [Allocoleopsis franciscana]|uniref:Cthe-2314-like HEPN domain-containing protein n=1 Tax=Allocoleopsis franciscana PCC 7113 TaxID=1173027 RepID=K9WDJ9_9CYAN|nr:hypothetical protein [Allocoleopsis franciscana]AFZ17886.1 hypothetical protein Mic7113_2069 [Allocoleopsis franciscana PCC 7113]
MFDKIRRDDFLKSHLDIHEIFSLKLQNNLCDGAKKHLHRGLIMRLMMMEESIFSLDEEIGKSEEPLDHYLATRLTLLLNAYYLNLAGSLDNLAWALTYQYSLVEEVDENNGKHRTFVQLLSTNFLDQLRKSKLEQLDKELQPFRDWYWDMRQFRDPAAHRIPLLVSHSVYSEEDVKKAQELDEAAAQLIRQDEWRDGMNLLHQSYQLEKHIPIFISENPKIQCYDLAGRVNLDHANWLRIVEVVLRIGFSG